MKRSKSKNSTPILILISIIFFFTGYIYYLPNAFAVPIEEEWTIRQDAVNTSTCNTINRICSSLASWEDAADGTWGDLVANNKIVIAKIEGAWTSPDTTPVTIDGWITSSTNYIKIYTTPEARHTGKWDTTKYRLEGGTQWSGLLTVSENNVRIDGIQAYHSYSGVSGENSAVYFSGEATGPYSWEIKNSIVKLNETSTVPTRNGIFFNKTSSDVVVNVSNNIIYDCLTGILAQYGTSGVFNIYNNTIINCTKSGINIGRDFPKAGTARLKNNLIQGTSSISNYVISANLSLLETATNISQDTSSPNTTLRSKTVSFQDLTNKDFHLSTTDAFAKDSGTDLSSDTNLSFTTDIDNQTRSGTWDIGADETSGGSQQADIIAPTITNFTIPSTSSSLTITITSFTATDSAGVTGYKLTETSLQPPASDTGWTSSAPANYTFSSSGSKTLYAWAKDSAGNVSTSSSQSTTITIQQDTTPPTTTASPIGGTYSSTQSVTLSCTDTGTGCDKTYYTTDNSTPTTSSTIYSSPISITSNTTLKYFSKDTFNNSETVKTESYIINISQSGIPSVANVSGTITNDSSITVTGSGFGVNGPNVLFFDDFESGTVGQNIKTGAGSATIGQWYSLNTVPVTYSSDFSLSGTKSFKAQAIPSVEGQVNGVIKLPSVTETFISWWCYVPTTVPWSGEGTAQGQNWKTMWLAMNGNYWNNGSDTYVWRSGAATGSNLSFANNSGRLAYPNTETVNVPYFTKGRWQKLVWWIKDGSNNDGSSSLWALSNTGIQLVRSFTNTSTVASSVVRTDLSVNGHFIQHPTGTQPIAYYDDIYVATGSGARARVEIGDAATYTTSKNLSIATVTSWSDTSIGATFRQGAFTNNSQAYLYVVDSSGNVNTNGYPITIGGTITDTTPPTGTIFINSDAAYSTSTAVTLTLFATDTESGMGAGAEMQFSNDNITWSTAESYATSKVWTLTTGDGTKTVYARFKDAAGNWMAAPVSDTIIFDTTVPAVSIAEPLDNAAVSGAVTILTNATDTNGVTGVQFKLDGVNLQAEDTTSPYSISWDTTISSNSSHTITAIARDSAGNQTTSAVVTVTVNNLTTTPDVTRVSGDLTHGSSITITGSGFGTKPTAAPLKWDNFENGTLGANLGNGWWSAAIGAPGGPLPKYVDTQVRPGSTLSVLQDYTYPGAGSTGAGRQYGASFGLVNQNIESIYVSYWRYMTVAGADNRNFKAFAFRGGAPGQWEDPEFRLDTYEQDSTNDYGFIYYVDCGGLETVKKDGAYFDDPVGVWTRFEVYINPGAPNTTDGVLWHMRDSVEKVRLTGAEGYAHRNDPYPWSYWYPTDGVFRTSSCSYSNIYLNAFYARDITDNNSSAYIWNDDVYIDNTQARVEICNASTWAAKTHCEIQIPSAWSDTSLTITANQGSLPNGQAYLYVIDANGNVNANGYPITIGGTTDTTAPVITVTSHQSPVNTSNITVTGTASDDVGVSSLVVNGIAAITTDNYATWSASFSLTEGANPITAIAKDAAGKEAQGSITVTLDTTAPVVSIAEPLNNAAVSGAVTILANATDVNGVTGVQFKLDGVNLQSEDTTSPYSIMWDTTISTNSSHTITAIARDSVGNQITSAVVTVTVNNLVSIPDVTGVSGTLTHGATLTITGSGFGTKAIAAPWRWDPIEGVSNYNSLNDGDIVPSSRKTLGSYPVHSQSGYWDDNDGYRISFNPSEQRGVSTKNVEMDNSTKCPSAEDNKKLFVVLPESPSNERYVSYWIWHSATFPSYINSKTIRWNHAEGTTRNLATHLTIQDSWGVNGPWWGKRADDFNTVVAWSNDGGPGKGSVSLSGGFVRPIGGEWERVEVYYKDESTPNSSDDGRIWIAQTAGGGIHTFDTGPRNTNGGTWASLNWLTFGFDHNCTVNSTGGPSQWKYGIRMDDIYIDNTRARVEIGNAPTWAANTYREIQIPSAWSDGSVTVTLNQGSLPNGQAYLYVIDANGNVNTNGYPITIGGTTETTPPTGTISINSDAAYSTSTAVTLTLSATDTESGMGAGAEMRFSNDNTTWSTAESYATSKVWTLSSGDGTKTVYAKFKDVAGNWMTTPVNDTIILDTTAPAVSIAEPLNNAAISGTVTILANATDTNGIAGVQFKLDGINLQAEDTTSPYSISWDTSISSNGSHTITATARDSAGNQTISSAITVTVNNLVTTPDVTRVSGDLTHGSSITIAGSGFGTKAIAAPWRWDPVEGVSAYNRLNDGDLVPDSRVNGSYANASASGYWDAQDGYRISFSSSEQRGISIKNLEADDSTTCPGSGVDNKKLTVVLPDSPSNERYVSYWVWHSATIEPYINSKNIRFWHAEGTARNNATVVMVQDSWGSNGPWYVKKSDDFNAVTAWCNDGGPGVGCRILSGGFTRPAGGQWERVELYYKDESSPNTSNDGRIWISQTSAGSIHTFDSGPTSVNIGTWYSLNWLTIGFDHNCSVNPNGPSQWKYGLRIDDIYIDNTRARVEIGNTSTWATNTQREIQIPSVWSDGSITVNFNQGSLPNGQAFIYVIDASGNVNSTGYPITLGGTIDTTPPTGTISINNNAAYTKSMTVTLTLSATDTESGMGQGAQMQFSNDNINWSTAESYATSKVWTLSNSDGIKTVYAKFKDVAGNWMTTTVSDTIILDLTPPRIPKNLRME